MSSFHPRLKAFLGMILFGIFGTLLSFFTKLDPGPIAPISSILTIGLGVWALVPNGWNWVGGLLLGASAEIVGLYTGLPFGSYEYTHAWVPTVSLPGQVAFPLCLPFAWLMIAGASDLSLSSLGRYPRALSAGLLAAIVDLVLEPVMVGPLGYWKWTEVGPLPGGAPLLNFIGWWLTAGVLSLALNRKEPRNYRVGVAVLSGHLALMLVVFLFSRTDLVTSPRATVASSADTYSLEQRRIFAESNRH